MVEISVGKTQRKLDLDDPKLPKWVSENSLSSANYAYDDKLKRSRYERELDALHLELVKLQAHRLETGQRMIIVFEGRDAAGKGGTIGAFREYLKPRHAKIVALSKPTETELGQWYFQRYVTHFSDQWRHDDVRPFLVQSRRCRTGNGVLLAQTKPTISRTNTGLRAADC